MSTDFDRKFKRYASKFTIKSLIYTFIILILSFVSVFSEAGIGVIGFSLRLGFVVSLIMVLLLNKNRKKIITEIDEAMDDGIESINKYKTRCNIVMLIPVLMLIYLFIKIYWISFG